jgi:hypothetical protein
VTRAFPGVPRTATEIPCTTRRAPANASNDPSARHPQRHPVGARRAARRLAGRHTSLPLACTVAIEPACDDFQLVHYRRGFEHGPRWLACATRDLGVPFVLRRRPWPHRRRHARPGLDGPWAVLGFRYRFSGRQVPTFRIGARTKLTPPTCRTPPGQLTGTRQARPRIFEPSWF